MLINLKNRLHFVGQNPSLTRCLPVPSLQQVTLYSMRPVAFGWWDIWTEQWMLYTWALSPQWTCRTWIPWWGIKRVNQCLNNVQILNKACGNFTNYVIFRSIVGKEDACVCQGYHNNIPQTGWLKTMETCSLRVLEAGCPKPKCQPV